MMAKETIKSVLAERIKDDAFLKITLYNLNVMDMSIDYFRNNVFDFKDLNDLEEYLVNPDNSYMLGMEGARYSGLSDIPAYNGMSSSKRYYEGGVTTLSTGARTTLSAKSNVK